MPPQKFFENYLLKNIGQILQLYFHSFYYFDFETQLAKDIFSQWKLAEEKGIFGSQDEQSVGLLQGHRMDETVMSICMYKNGIEPMTYTGSRYNWDSNAIMIKKHFK